MKVYNSIEEAKDLRAPIIATIGNFDGVHLGHQKIMRKIAERASETGGASVAITFHPHPMLILSLDKLQKLISTVEQKLELISATGVDATIIIPFTKEFSHKSPETFIDAVLGAMPVFEIYIGADFRFGYLNAGDAELLGKIGEKKNFRVMCVPFVEYQGEKLGSSLIRRLIGEGKVEESAKLLGRYYAMDGEIINGAGLGRRLQIPTANLRSFNEIVPATGVYATRITVDNVKHPGVTNVGYRPTVRLHSGISIETHILSFDAQKPFRSDILGKRVRLEFVKFLRDEQKFSSTEDLKMQIMKDCETALKLVKKYF